MFLVLSHWARETSIEPENSPPKLPTVPGKVEPSISALMDGIHTTPPLFHIVYTLLENKWYNDSNMHDSNMVFVYLIGHFVCCD